MSTRYEMTTLALRIWSLVFLAQFKTSRVVLRIEEWLHRLKCRYYFVDVKPNEELRGW